MIRTGEDDKNIIRQQCKVLSKQRKKYRSENEGLCINQWLLYGIDQEKLKRKKAIVSIWKIQDFQF